jgi:uncharacterized protein (TIGR02588 family)
MQSEERRSDPQMPLAEKLIGGMGLLLVVAITGYLVYLGLQAAEPPQLHIQPLRTVIQQGSYLVEISVENSGGETAKDVIVEGQLLPAASRGGAEAQPVETSQTTFDFAPPSSNRKGGLFFQRNPANYDLRLRPKSYIQP